MENGLVSMWEVKARGKGLVSMWEVKVRGKMDVSVCMTGVTAHLHGMWQML